MKYNQRKPSKRISSNLIDEMTSWSVHSFISSYLNESFQESSIEDEREFLQKWIDSHPDFQHGGEMSRRYHEISGSKDPKVYLEAEELIIEMAIDTEKLLRKAGGKMLYLQDLSLDFPPHVLLSLSIFGVTMHGRGVKIADTLKGRFIHRDAYYDYCRR